MNPELFIDLMWLPQPPPDFRNRCNGIADSGVVLGNELRALASFALGENHLNRLANVIAKARMAKADLKPLVPFRLAMLSNATVDFVLPALIGTAARYGIALECVKGDYSQVMQEALREDSAINCAKPDAVLIALDYRALPLRSKLGSLEDAGEAVRETLSYIDTVCAGLKANSETICIVQSIAPPPDRLFGSMDRVLPGTLRNTIDRVNLALAEKMYGKRMFSWTLPDSRRQ